MFLLCYERKFNTMPLKFPNNNVNILKSIMIMFQDLLSFVVSHEYWMFFIYKTLWNKKFGNWVKTWSITWIFHFLMTQYEDFRWIDHFRITCKFVEQLIAKIKHFVEKKIITYKCAILVNIYVVCSFYKLAHGAKYLHYSELFVIEKSTIHVILWKYVCFVN